MTTRIDTPYDPDACRGEFGWLWMGSDSGDREWQLVYTDLPDGIDAEPQLRAIAHDLGDGADVLEAADIYVGRPYLSASPPAADPGAALLVEMRLPGGGKMSMAWADDGPGARRARDAIRAEMMRPALTVGRDRHTAARDALIACRDALYGELILDLESLCRRHADGTPNLQSLARSDCAAITHIAHSLRAAEIAVGRGDIPAWLGEALDTWPKEVAA